MKRVDVKKKLFNSKTKVIIPALAITSTLFIANSTDPLATRAIHFRQLLSEEPAPTPIADATPPPKAVPDETPLPADAPPKADAGPAPAAPTDAEIKAAQAADAARKEEEWKQYKKESRDHHKSTQAGKARQSFLEGNDGTVSILDQEKKGQGASGRWEGFKSANAEYSAMRKQELVTRNALARELQENLDFLAAKGPELKEYAKVNGLGGLFELVTYAEQLRGSQATDFRPEKLREIAYKLEEGMKLANREQNLVRHSLAKAVSQSSGDLAEFGSLQLEIAGHGPQLKNMEMLETRMHSLHGASHAHAGALSNFMRYAKNLRASKGVGFVSKGVVTMRSGVRRTGQKGWQKTKKFFTRTEIGRQTFMAGHNILFMVMTMPLFALMDHFTASGGGENLSPGHGGGPEGVPGSGGAGGPAMSDEEFLKFLASLEAAAPPQASARSNGPAADASHTVPAAASHSEDDRSRHHSATTGI